MGIMEARAAVKPVSILIEIGAYEWLWQQRGASFKTIADRFRADPGTLPSDFTPIALAIERGREVVRIFAEASISRFGVRINHAGEYPVRLRDARHPIELLYYAGNWEVAERKSVAIIGSRKPSDEGIARASRLATEMVASGFVVASGIAAGIDRAAHTAAIAAKGRTIAVIGTPLHQCYPAENARLQHQIARDHLLISQVPVLRHRAGIIKTNRFFFPERNATMSALTEATIIVEAGEMSGTLTQARAALHQGRKLFILDSCFHRKDITWPARFQELGAIRVKSSDDILGAIDD